MGIAKTLSTTNVSAPRIRTKSTAKKQPKTIRLIDIMLAVMAIELLAGGIIVVREIMEQRKMKEQIVQISKFNSAVATFQNKYMGLPGDLLSAQAERVGFSTGDGTPAHSDGDGQLSPCSPEWSEGLGCETALFWTQLAGTEMIEGKFTAAARYADNRVLETDLPQYYLPTSPLAPDVHLMVWHADNVARGSKKFMPSGNYYQLTIIHGIDDGKILNDPYALSPLAAKEIDKKLDDGYPLSGKILVNGRANSEKEGWNKLARADNLECVSEGEVYNTRDYFKAHRRLCHLAIAIEANRWDK